MNQAEPKPIAERQEIIVPRLCADSQYVRAMPWVLLSLVILTIVVDLFFFTGFYSSDDIEYFSSARQWWLHGRYAEDTALDFVAAQRMVMVGWLRLMIGVLGPHPQSLAATFVVFHLALILLTYALSKRIFDWKVGLVAAYFTALTPPFILYSTTILPDIPLACFFVLSLYAFLRAYDKASGQAPSPWWMLLCGLAVGWSYEAKESGLILLPFYFFLWLAMSRGRRISTVFGFGVLFLLGVAIVFVYDFVALSYLYHRSLMRLSWTVQELDPAIRQHIGRYGLNPLDRLGWAKRRINEFAYFIPWWGKWCLVAALASYPFIRRTRWPIFAMFSWLFVYHTWGSMRWTEYFPPSIQARYYVCVLPFAIIMLAFVLCRIGEQIRRIRYAKLQRGISWAAIAFLVILPLPGLRVADEKAGKAYRSATIANAAEAISFARKQLSLPIAVSAYIQHRMCYLYQDSHSNDLLQATQIDEPKLVALLRDGGFYYVESMKQTFATNILVDSCLHAAATDNLTLPGPRQSELPVIPWAVPIKPEVLLKASRMKGPPLAYWSTTDGVVGYFFAGNIKAAVYDIGWFSQLKTRTASVRLVLGHSAVPSRYIDKKNVQSVHLLRIVPLSESSSDGPLNHGDDLFVNQPATFDFKAEDWAMTGRSKPKGSVAANTPPFSVEMTDGKLSVLIASERKDYEWFTLRKSWAPELLKLEAPGDYEFIIDSEVKDSAKAELRFGVFADAQYKQKIFEKRIELRSGRARFGISTDLYPVYFKPDLKLLGHGSFELSSFTVRRIH